MSHDCIKNVDRPSKLACMYILNVDLRRSKVPDSKFKCRRILVTGNFESRHIDARIDLRRSHIDAPFSMVATSLLGTIVEGRSSMLGSIFQGHLNHRTDSSSSNIVHDGAPYLASILSLLVVL